MPGNADYAREGRELLERVNLQLDGAPKRYEDSDPIYRHAATGATLLVGNAEIASSRPKLVRPFVSSVRSPETLSDTDLRVAARKGSTHLLGCWMGTGPMYRLRWRLVLAHRVHMRAASVARSLLRLFWRSAVVRLLTLSLSLSCLAS
jgi:hypothetical protein